MGGHIFNRNRRAVRVCAALALATCLCGTTGCSLLYPARADVERDQVLTKLTEPAIATKGVLAVGLDASDAPQAVIQEDGTATGYLADVARALAQRLGLKVVFVDSTDPSSAGDGSSDGFDIYLGATSDEVEGSVGISGTVLENAPALFGTSDAAGTLTAADLASQTIAVQSGSATKDTLTKSGIECEQKTYDNVNACFEALEAGEVDYVACDATSGAYLARVYSNVSFAGSLDSSTISGIAMRTSSVQLVSAVEEALNSLSSDGTLDAIHGFWYGNLPMSLSDTLIQGVTTSQQRKEAEEQAAREAEQQDAENADEQQGDDTASSSNAEEQGSQSQAGDASTSSDSE